MGIEKKKGRHLGHGSRKGTRNARCSTKMLWMKRQRAMRRLLVRYKLAGKIDRKMYHRYYLKAKGNSFKNKANLIERINGELSEKKRNQQLLEQYKVRREEILARKLEKEKRKQKFLDNQLKLAEEAEKLRLRQESAKKTKGRKSGGGDDDDDKPKKARRRRTKKTKDTGADKGDKGGSGGGDKPKPKRKRPRKRGGGGN